MNRRTFQHLWSLGLALALSLGGANLHAQSAEGPDQLIKRLSTDVLDTIKTDKDVQSGDVRKIVTFVDAKVMPHVNFTRMTASAVGRNWRQATPEQQKPARRVQDHAGAHLLGRAQPGQGPDCVGQAAAGGCHRH
jgi:phospholipid transport system substrate-binding protein